jgi:hypothetical protein
MAGDLAPLYIAAVSVEIAAVARTALARAAIVLGAG